MLRDCALFGLGPTHVIAGLLQLLLQLGNAVDQHPLLLIRLLLIGGAREFFIAELFGRLGKFDLELSVTGKEVFFLGRQSGFKRGQPLIPFGFLALYFLGKCGLAFAIQVDLMQRIGQFFGQVGLLAGQRGFALAPLLHRGLRLL